MLDEPLQTVGEPAAEMPRLAWKSSKRRTPANACLTITNVQRSPSTASGRLIEHGWAISSS